MVRPSILISQGGLAVMKLGLGMMISLKVRVGC